MISREERKSNLIEYLDDVVGARYYYLDTEDREMIIKALSQPERPKGQWNPISADRVRCTSCDAIRDITTQLFWDFCPKCGADMREVQWVDTGISPEIIHTAEPSRPSPPQHLRITQDDETIKNFILCKSPDGKVGYYETEEEKFYEFDMRGEEE